MVVFFLDDLKVFFPYDYIYPEQYAYMKYLKKTLDSEGHCVLEMPTGTGKTVAIFSLITSYQYHKNDDSKFIFCTRTVAEMEKSLIELKKVIKYRNMIIEKSNKKKEINNINNDNININDNKNNINDNINNNENNINDNKNNINNNENNINDNINNVNDNINNVNDNINKKNILAIGLSARRCMCVNDNVMKKYEREKIDEECLKLTANFIRDKAYLKRKIQSVNEINKSTEHMLDFIIKNKNYLDIEDINYENKECTMNEYEEMGLCGYYENLKNLNSLINFESGVYTIEELKRLCKNNIVDGVKKPICPYFCAKKLIELSSVIVLNYQYVIDPRVSKSISLNNGKNFNINTNKDYIVFDEAHNIDSVCLEALSVNINRDILNKATQNINGLLKKIEESKKIHKEKLLNECKETIKKLKKHLNDINDNNNNNIDINDNKNYINNKNNINIDKNETDINNKMNIDINNKMDIDINNKINIDINNKMNIDINNKMNIDINNINENNKENINKKRKIENEIDFDDDLNLIFNELDAIIQSDNENNINENINNNINENINNVLSNINLLPGNIKKNYNFLNLMRIIIYYLKKYINTYKVTSEGPLSFLYKFEKETKLDTNFFKYTNDRLKMLLDNFQIINVDEYFSLNIICNFCTLLGTYVNGFIIICEPYPEATGIYDPVLQFACLDSSIAMRNVLEKYKNVILTSATISPLELYPKLLKFDTILTASLPMSFDRKCVCPLIVTKSIDLIPLSSQYNLRSDMNVIKNYGILLIEMCKNIPDGLVAYFPSYIYMEQVIYSWYEMGIINNILKYKLIFIETKDIVSTTIALHHFKKACDYGRGAVFLSICRGKIAEGIDFDKHYGKCVILFGIPYQYTLSKILKARLDFLKEKNNIEENEFLTFDAMRQASQCVGRIIRNKKDYGIMIFSDIRYSKKDKKNKIPPWIIKCMDISNLNLSISTAVNISKQFLLNMSQEYKETDQTKLTQSMLLDPKKCWNRVKLILNMEDDFI